LSEVILSLTFF